MTRGIFISYRRSDSSGYAGRIFDRLAPSFSRERVFMDVDNIELGVDFVEVLSDRVGSCDALLAIIGHDWLDSLDARGKRRLDDPHDFVRIEIEAALKRNTRVIPVLVEGATMPSSEELPEPLKALARRQGVEISHNRFDSDADILIRALRRIIDAKDLEREAAAAPRQAASEAPAATRGDDGGAASRPGARDAHPPRPTATTLSPGPAAIDPSDDGGAASRRPGARDAHPPGGAVPEHTARSNEQRATIIQAGHAKPFVYHRGMRIAGDIVIVIVVWIAALMVVGFSGLWLGIRASAAVTLVITTILAGFGYMALRHLRVRPPGEPRA